MDQLGYRYGSYLEFENMQGSIVEFEPDFSLYMVTKPVGHTHTRIYTCKHI